jgi:hypothetical protein
MDYFSIISGSWRRGADGATMGCSRAGSSATKEHDMKIARSIFAVAVMLVGISAYAQSLDRSSWTVNVPFDFTVRHINAEAGKYLVRQVGMCVLLTSESGRTVNVLTQRSYISQPAAHSSLVFTINNGEYALTQITDQGSSTELNAVTSKHAPQRLEATRQTIEVTVAGTR